MAKVPPYISNRTLGSDLKIRIVTDEAKTAYRKFHNNITSQPPKSLACIGLPMFLVIVPVDRKETE